MNTSDDDSAATFVALKTLLYSVCDNIETCLRWDKILMETILFVPAILKIYGRMLNFFWKIYRKSADAISKMLLKFGWMGWKLDLLELVEFRKVLYISL